MNTKYVFDSSLTEHERLSALASEYDSFTKWNLEKLPFKSDWVCGDVGAGTGSIAQYISQKLGTNSRVIAIDKNLSHLKDLKSIEIQQKDILVDDLGESVFDFLHTRLLLMHLPDPKSVIKKLLRALKPGGWLLLEEMDYVSTTPCSTHNDSTNKVISACRKAFETIGFNPYFGRNLPIFLQELGMSNTKACGFSPVTNGTSSYSKAQSLGIHFLADKLKGTGIVTDTDLENFYKSQDDHRSWIIDFMLVAAWGQKQ